MANTDIREEMKAKGQDVNFDEVLSDINKRDYDDSHRKIDPLKKADDAIELDTTNMSIEEVKNYILKEIEKNVHS